MKIRFLPLCGSVRIGNLFNFDIQVCMKHKIQKEGYWPRFFKKTQTNKQTKHHRKKKKKPHEG